MLLLGYSPDHIAVIRFGSLPAVPLMHSAVAAAAADGGRTAFAFGTYVAAVSGTIQTSAFCSNHLQPPSVLRSVDLEKIRRALHCTSEKQQQKTLTTLKKFFNAQ